MGAEFAPKNAPFRDPPCPIDGKDDADLRKRENPTRAVLESGSSDAPPVFLFRFARMMARLVTSRRMVDRLAGG
jgi:hypothetical protein